MELSASMQVLPGSRNSLGGAAQHFRPEGLAKGGPEIRRARVVVRWRTNLSKMLHPKAQMTRLMHRTAGFRLCFILKLIGPPPVTPVVRRY